MLELKLAMALRRMECMGMPTYIDGKKATEQELFLFELALKKGLFKANAYANKLGIFYVTF
jgi:hypothetical protein